MGILSRWRFYSRPRQAGTGRLWDNSNRGAQGNVGPASTTTITDITTPARTNAYVRGPNPEMYLQSGAWKDPSRKFSPFQHLQPRVPVSEPWAVSSTYIQNVNTSTGQPKNQVAPGPYVGKIKSISPPMVTQRDTLYDDANFHRLQRFYFAKTPSQQYFDQRTPLPEFTTPSVPTNMVIAGNNEYFPVESQPGWRQTYVPFAQPRDADQMEVGTSPPWLLSTPLNVKQITYSEYDTRRPLINAKAPKRKRSGTQ